MTQVTRRSCEEAVACDGRVRAGELARLRRYYVPESHARDAEQRLRNAAARDGAQLVVAVDLDPAGQPQVKELLVDGKPLLP